MAAGFAYAAVPRTAARATARTIGAPLQSVTSIATSTGAAVVRTTTATGSTVRVPTAVATIDGPEDAASATCSVLSRRSHATSLLKLLLLTNEVGGFPQRLHDKKKGRFPFSPFRRVGF